MRPIIVNKAELLAKVEANLELHRKIFEEAVLGYKASALAELDRHITRLRHNKIGKIYLALPVPQDHTKDYLNAIEMIKMAVGDTIEIDESGFNQFVRDDWTWKREFAHTTVNYSSLANDTYGNEEEES
jgi:hypothetical protein